jgi:hypothetical protein
MTDSALMDKYKLSSTGLQSLFKKLIDAGLLKQSEIDDRMPLSQKTVDILLFRCPACGMPQFNEFHECPQCGIIVSNFMSHTSASNLLIPIVTSLTVIAPLSGSSPITQLGTLGVAFAASLAMSLPISTPPNAIAFATREITTREMAKYGTMVSLFGVLVILLVLLGLWYLKMIT